jgi:hypothetical protein
MARLRRRLLELTNQAHDVMQQAENLTQHADKTLSVADKAILQLSATGLIFLEAAVDLLDELRDGVHLTLQVAGKNIPVRATITFLEDGDERKSDPDPNSGDVRRA